MKINYYKILINYNLDKEITNLISEEAMGIFLKVSNLSPVSTEEGSLSRYYISIAALEKGDVEQARLIWEEIKLKVPKDFEWKKNNLENISKLEEKFSIAENDNKIRAMVDKLEKRLLDNDSNDISDWKMLGKSSLILQTLFNALNLTLNNNKSRKIPKPIKGYKGTEMIDLSLIHISEPTSPRLIS